MIFNFGFGERGLIVNAPVDRTRAFVNIAALDERPNSRAVSAS